MSEEPLHVVIRLPYRRPSGFVEPPSIIWTEAMEQKLWEILTQNKRQSIDWNLASRILNVPIPYILRHAAFLYETQLRGVQAQLRRGELSTNNGSGNLATVGAGTTRTRTSSRASLTKVSTLESGDLFTRTRASSRASSTKIPAMEASDPSSRPRASSRASLTKVSEFENSDGGATTLTRSPSSTSIKEQFHTSLRGSGSSANNAPQDTFTTSTSPLSDPSSAFQVKNPIMGNEMRVASNVQTPQTVSPSYPRRPLSAASSVSTIMPSDQINSNPRSTATQGTYISMLPTIQSESVTTASFETPAGSISEPFIRTFPEETSSVHTEDLTRSIRLHSPSSEDEDPDDDYQESKDSMMEQSTAASFSERLKRLQGVAAFLPLNGGNSSSRQVEDTKVNRETVDLSSNTGLIIPIIDPAINPTFIAQTARDLTSTNSSAKISAPTADSLSGQNSMGSSFSDLSDSSVTRSALEDAIMSSNFGGSKMSVFSRKNSYFPGS